MLWFFWTLQVLLQRWWCLTWHCVHTDTKGKPRERPESDIYFKIFEKTQYLMNTLYMTKMRNIVYDRNLQKCWNFLYMHCAARTSIFRRYSLYLRYRLPWKYFLYLNARTTTEKRSLFLSSPPPPPAPSSARQSRLLRVRGRISLKRSLYLN